jgi:hypothetical protein
MRLVLTYLLIAGLSCLAVLHWLEADDLLPTPLRYTTWADVLDFPSGPDAVKTSTSPLSEGDQ